MTARRLLLLGLVLALLAPDAAQAQSITLDMGDGSSTTGRILQLIILTTLLSVAPSILIMVTSFTRIVVVLSFLRTALGTQNTPPQMVMASLAVFLTFFIMAPTFQESYQQGLAPLIGGKVSELEALNRAAKPFHAFMLKHTRDKDIGLFLEISKTPMPEAAEATPLQVLIPAFMISELRRAFEIGFLIFVPFVIIDMVVSSVLMSMGMMMLPPTMIAMPFKIIFFVLIDGWYLIVGSLVKSFGV
ncbi:MAG: flagellar type III secretion system pore protein FliP [Rhodospirillales bacterium]|jgi:flagellar biosynthetic protein FliP|nr:flagellar type III secretion system pore protein FliP [Rhodospirillales bacterium]MDK9721269.1 flagellar type III secretion system pore protein FliP [Rhodospirillales bacterium]